METMEKLETEKTILQRLEKLMGRSVYVYSEEELLQKKLETLQNIEGKHKGFRCEKCKNRGIVYFIRDGSIASRRCDCMDMRETLLRMEESGLKDVVNNYTVGKFQTPKPWHATAREKAMAYAADPKGWFFIGGQSGSGKTHLCAAIGSHLMNMGTRLVYMPWGQDAPVLKVMRYEDKKSMELLEKIKTAPVLYIDDLLKTPAGTQGRVSPTAADVTLAFEIVNYRYLKDLPTIISTELYPDELNALDEALAGRIMEKAAGNLLRIERDKEKDWRMKGVLEL